MKSTQHRFVILLFLIFHVATSHSFRLPAKLNKIPGLSSMTGSSNSDESKTSKGKVSNNNDPSEKKELLLVVKPKWARILYFISILNPFIAVFFNDYSRMLEPFPQIQTKSTHNLIVKTVEGVFTVVRMKPRVSFAVGALLRALQTNTAFQYVINPPAGVGFGLNVVCLLANSRWPATIFLGWCMTGPIWKILGARAPTSSPVPITINFTKKGKVDTSNNQNNRVEEDDQPPTQTGYRIGL